MAQDNYELPFPRGKCSTDGIQLANPTGSSSRLTGISATPLFGVDSGTTFSNIYRPDFAGFIGNCRDTKNGSNVIMKLRAVQNATGAAITVARKGIAFDITKGRFAICASSLTPTAGHISRPIDDMYAVGYSIPAGDWFWVVEEGPCEVLVTNGSTVNQGNEASVYSDGTFKNSAAGDVPTGVWRGPLANAADASSLTGNGTLTWILYVCGALSLNETNG
jgi:hypothetical protein